MLRYSGFSNIPSIPICVYSVVELINSNDEFKCTFVHLNVRDDNE